MPTTEQLSKIWEAELEFPSIRREDDPMYVPPDKFKQYQESRKLLNSEQDDDRSVASKADSSTDDEKQKNQ